MTATAPPPTGHGPEEEPNHGDAEALAGAPHHDEAPYYGDEYYAEDGYHEAFHPDDPHDQYEELPPAAGPGLRIIGVVAIIGIVVVGLIVGAQLLAGLVAGEPEPTITPGVEVVIDIPPGSSARSIGALLEDNGVIVSAGDFERAVRERGAASRLQAGQYTVVTGTELGALVQQLSQGPPAADTFRLTVIEGLRIEEMLQSMAEQTDYEFADFAAPLLDGSITSSLLPEQVPEGDRAGLIAWEGLLAPDTFEFVVDATPVDMLTTMARTLERRVEGVDWAVLELRGFTPYEGLIIASLIEKEAKLDEDRALIASVIVNRLDLGMALQVDATIIYALGGNPGRVLLRDLEIDSPYNTYRNPGLPPTPIAGVRNASLAAAAAPATTDFLYYVLVDASGAHGFSETLAEHNQKKTKAKADGVIP